MNNNNNNQFNNDFISVPVPITEEATDLHIGRLEEIPSFFLKHHNFFINELSEVIRQKLELSMNGAGEEAVRNYFKQQGHIEGRIDLLKYFIKLSSPSYQESLENDNE